MTCSATQPVFNRFLFASFPRLTPSDARTVSIIMRGMWSGATPLLIMVLFRLGHGQDVPLVLGKTCHISIHVFSSLRKTSLSGSIIMVCQCVCVIDWLLCAWHLCRSFNDLLLPSKSCSLRSCTRIVTLILAPSTFRSMTVFNNGFSETTHLAAVQYNERKGLLCSDWLEDTVVGCWKCLEAR